LLSNAVAGNLERRMSPARCGRLTGEPQVAFLGATDQSADRRSPRSGLNLIKQTRLAAVKVLTARARSSFCVRKACAQTLEQIRCEVQFWRKDF
jgi:hypothetical protein